MTTQQTEMFSLASLDVFKRPGVKEIEKRDDTRHSGCWVRFENGWVMSIQWGCGNYSDNYDKPLDARPEDSTTAEIAVWRDAEDHNHDLVRWGTDGWGDTVQGYVSMARVQHILNLLAEDKLTQTYTPPPEPPPEPEERAVDNWTED